MSFNLDDYYYNSYPWSLETFGPGERNEGVVDHIRKELDEILTAKTKFEAIEEFIDVFILSLDGLFRNGLSAEDVLILARAKMLKNRMRAWPDWRTAEPGKAIEHID